jgi:carbamoyl-phosphate synthase large subunit
MSSRYRVHFADADPEARPASVPPDAWHAIPLASAAGFIESVTDLCRRLAVDVLVPGVDEELLAISAARATVAPEVLLPPTGFIETHLDKLASNGSLASVGIPVPVTEPYNARYGVSFPCIVKPRRGRGSRDVAVVRSEEELRAHAVATRRSPDQLIVQERLLGQEFTVTMVADRAGVLRAIVPVKVGIKRGVTIRAETDDDEIVTSACAAIHRAQPVPGCFNIQLIKTDAGEVKPFEINPRISTTTCLALAAGVDFVALYLASPEPAGVLAPFQNGLRLKRSWHNEFIGPGVPA